MQEKNIHKKDSLPQLIENLRKNLLNLMDKLSDQRMLKEKAA